MQTQLSLQLAPITKRCTSHAESMSSSIYSKSILKASLNTTKTNKPSSTADFASSGSKRSWRNLLSVGTTSRVSPVSDNPDCRFEYFRPFPRKSFYFCPSCSQKRTLLFSEYLKNNLLLSLPHRQFIFTVPRILRLYFRHDRRLFIEVSRVIFVIIQRF
jgi:hypothetical protein